MKRIAAWAVMAGLLVTGTAAADTAVGLRAGTLGIGLDLNVGLTETLNLRVGYSAFDYDDTIEDTDLSYDGELKLRNASALLDWHPFNGGFRFSVGAIGGGTKVDVTGKPADDATYTINDEVFSASQVGSVRGDIEMGSSVAPYVGIGWGNTVDKEDRVTLLFDIGAIYAGEPDVQLTATCGPAATPQICAELQDAVQVEEDDLADEATLYEWYPVLSIGFAVRF